MTAYHIIDIEKTDADEKDIALLEFVLCATFDDTAIITDSEGSMYSLYAEINIKGIGNFAKGALSAIQLRDAFEQVEAED